MSLGTRITELRSARHLSMRKVALEAGISVAYLSKLERDEASNPSIDILERLAKALGVDVPELRPTAGTSGTPQLPESLKHFIANYRARFRELDGRDWQEALARVRLRGRYPETDKDWMNIFAAMRGALDGDE